MPTRSSANSACTQKRDPAKGATLSTKFRGPQVPGRRRPIAVPERRSGSGQPAARELRGLPAGPQHSPAAASTVARGPLALPVVHPAGPRSPEARRVRDRCGRRAPRLPRDEAPPLAARLAAGAGSAGSHWPGGGARTGGAGLHNRRRVGGGEGPRAGYITRRGWKSGQSGQVGV